MRLPPRALAPVPEWALDTAAPPALCARVLDAATRPDGLAPPPPIAGAPPPGTSRFRCRYPGCKKLYASTDAVRKHCRKRHLEWLRRIDLVSAHERGLPKPALYCIWGEEEAEDAEI